MHSVTCAPDVSSQEQIFIAERTVNLAGAKGAFRILHNITILIPKPIFKIEI